MKNFFLTLSLMAFSSILVIAQGCLPEGISLTTQSQIDNFQINYPGCTEIEGAVIIQGSDITNLNGLNVPTSIGGGLSIWGDWALPSLTGLDNLTSIGGGLEIHYNFSVTSLTGLANMTSIGGGLSISVNDALTSLSALDNIEAASITNLQIRYNNSLSTCEVQSICEYLASPNGTIEIHDNDPGCNSPEEVILACQAITMEEINPGAGISILPNPATGIITISHLGPAGTARLTIFNTGGGKVLDRQLTYNETQINISALTTGVYFVWVQNEGLVEVRKMVKE